MPSCRRTSPGQAGTRSSDLSPSLMVVAGAQVPPRPSLKAASLLTPVRTPRITLLGRTEKQVRGSWLPGGCQ